MNQTTETKIKEPWRHCTYCRKDFDTMEEFNAHFEGKAWPILSVETEKE